MNKLNYMALTEAFNKFRMEHQSKTYTRPEIIKELNSLGFSTPIAATILSKGYVPSERVGKSKLYSFGKEPMHKSQLEALYQIRSNYNIAQNDKKKQVTNEEEAISSLQAMGYQIRKVIGFDLERFQKENPVLYKRYLKYEIV